MNLHPVSSLGTDRLEHLSAPKGHRMALPPAEQPGQELQLAVPRHRPHVDIPLEHPSGARDVPQRRPHVEVPLEHPRPPDRTRTIQPPLIDAVAYRASRVPGRGRGRRRPPSPELRRELRRPAAGWADRARGRRPRNGARRRQATRTSAQRRATRRARHWAPPLRARALHVCARGLPSRTRRGTAPARHRPLRLPRGRRARRRRSRRRVRRCGRPHHRHRLSGRQLGLRRPQMRPRHNDRREPGDRRRAREVAPAHAREQRPRSVGLHGPSRRRARAARPRRSLSCAAACPHTTRSTTSS